MSQQADRAVEPGTVDSGWKALYRVAAVGILIAVVFFRRYLTVELITFQGFGLVDVPTPFPVSAADWFDVLQRTPFLGLVLLDLSDLINYLLVGLLFLALYGALRRANEAAMVVATGCTLVGISVYLASNQAFTLLTLSGRHAAAGEAERAAFLAAGEALLAGHNPGSIHQGTGIYLGLFLVLLAGLIISVVMLRSRVFGRATAVIGILANGIALTYFLALAFANEAALLALPPALAALFRELWYILVAVQLFRLARATSERETVAA